MRRHLLITCSINFNPKPQNCVVETAVSELKPETRRSKWPTERALQDEMEPVIASIKAKVARRVGDVVVVITEVIGEEDTNRLPSVGDTVRFSSGAVAYVVALGDVCYAGVLINPAEEVQEVREGSFSGLEDMFRAIGCRF